MRTYITLFLMSTICLGVSAQEKTFTSKDPAYIQNVTAGEEALIAGDYGACLTYYATAFEIKQTSFLSILRAAACAHSADEIALRDKYLDTAFGINVDGAVSVYKRNDEFSYLRDTNFGDLVHQRFLKAYPDFDQALADQLSKVRRSDQAQRGQMRKASEKYGRRSPQMDSLWALQRESDSLNTEYITRLIDERGYPGKSIVGDNSSTAFLVIQHAELAVQEKYLPVLRAAAEAGEFRYSSLALLIDRIEQRNNRPQIYGSQVGHDEETGEFFFFPIAQPYKVDSLRESVGLGPLTEYAENWDFAYDPEKHLARRAGKE